MRCQCLVAARAAVKCRAITVVLLVAARHAVVNVCRAMHARADARAAVHAVLCRAMRLEVARAGVLSLAMHLVAASV
jgi:hypothetical protein